MHTHESANTQTHAHVCKAAHDITFNNSYFVQVHAAVKEQNPTWQVRYMALYAWHVPNFSFANNEA